MTQNEFLQYIQPFKDKIYRLAKRLLISKEAAEDATQEILLKLWSQRTKLRHYKSAEAFSITMTKNFCYDILKSKQAKNLKLSHNDYEEKHTALQQEIELKDSAKWVERLINELPKQQRTIIQLRDIEAYDFESIATIMNMNSTAVRVALSRARKTIREQLIKTHNYGVK